MMREGESLGSLRRRSAKQVHRRALRRSVCVSVCLCVSKSVYVCMHNRCTDMPFAPQIPTAGGVPDRFHPRHTPHTTHHTPHTTSQSSPSTRCPVCVYSPRCARERASTSVQKATSEQLDSVCTQVYPQSSTRTLAKLSHDTPSTRTNTDAVARPGRTRRHRNHRHHAHPRCKRMPMRIRAAWRRSLGDLV